MTDTREREALAELVACSDESQRLTALRDCTDPSWRALGVRSTAAWAAARALTAQREAPVGEAVAYRVWNKGWVYFDKPPGWARGPSVVPLYATPQPLQAGWQPIETLLSFAPNFGHETPEPNLSSLIHRYYQAHFPNRAEATELAQRYIEAMLAAAPNPPHEGGV